MAVMLLCLKSHSQAKAFDIKNFTKEICFVTGDARDTTYQTLYNIGGVINMPDTSIVDHLVCELYEQVMQDGVLVTNTLNSLPVSMKGIGTSAYNQLNNQDYFMESGLLYFMMKSLDATPDRFFRISAYSIGNAVLQQEIINLNF